MLSYLCFDATLSLFLRNLMGMSIKISKVATVLALFFIPVCLSAQTKSLGFKLNPSLGFIRSSGFKKASRAIESNSNGSIQEYDVRAKAGFQFGVGGFFQYEVNERFTVLTDPSFNYFRSKITQNYIAQTYSVNNQEVQHSIRSTAQIKYFYVNIPIMVKYEVLPYQKVFVSGGASVNINMSPKVYADEDSVTNFIQQGEIYATTVKKISSQATLNKFSPVSFNLNLGVGKSFLMGRYYNLDIELRYQFPLTGTAIYTTDQAYASETVLNNVFSQAGKEELESSSGKSLNRFRSSVLSLSIRYILWSK
jgi:hypothetical protein